MASKKRRPGYEPAHGFPDPEEIREAAGPHTHYPHMTGAVCNIRPVPTNAGSYVDVHDPTDEGVPTCPTCRQYCLAVRERTARVYSHASQAPVVK